jgi:hypothetical protein
MEMSSLPIFVTKKGKVAKASQGKETRFERRCGMPLSSASTSQCQTLWVLSDAV